MTATVLLYLAIILAFVIGGLVGALVMALAAVAKDADAQDDETDSTGIGA